jgi:hypothetical protein
LEFEKNQLLGVFLFYIMVNITANSLKKLQFYKAVGWHQWRGGNDDGRIADTPEVCASF